ncbi:adenosylmethionine--8-amino-7-oxononanoate transaminase [Enhygromyxa salina]|uniref:Adenosylmethionine-8-amino-7-oxononanoate aminotransferase n=1 Tax=Enhygromyxa salina TaxID=215803 RepID=A0A2S9YRA7_9BACT|nr:adenosylmethionine--8-amino-7-oxononanoate transaminase [Enhygromyxa salina]PRQ07631.1 Adenosylmethionine-8-amino-7-oxononanoate aminotransferase [Enhygromyxa salina]
MSELSRRDQAVLWHPATHFGDLERTPPLPIHSARGVWLTDEDGRQILDGIGSWWTSIHGHGHPHIVAAIQRQVARLDHVMFAGFTHEPAIELAERLLALAPRDEQVHYGKVFYSDCGSASVEVALKLSYQSRVLTDQPRRRRFAALQRSYHGETLGALSVCGSEAWREPFSALLHDALYLPVPSFPAHEHADLQPGGGYGLGADTPEADRAVALLEAHAHELTALVVEPLIQCASRMNMFGVGFYQRLVDTCRRLDIHVIADEIAVAFGRTGKLFASEWAGRAPDLLCLSKGLSGGVLPLAATLIRAGFEAPFQGDPARSFAHSHTFTGNPITCAAGLASLEVFEAERTLDRLPERVAQMAALRRELADRHPQVIESRQAGLVGALTLDRARGPADGRLSLALREAALARQVLLRPLHDTIYWMPALNIDAAALSRLAEVTSEVIDEVMPR